MSDSTDADGRTRKRRAEEEHSGAPSTKRPRRFQEIDRLNNEWRNEIAILQTRLESIGNYHNIPALESDTIKSGLIALRHMCRMVAIGGEPSIDALNAFKSPFLDAISIDQLPIPESVPAFRASIYKTVLESLKVQLVVVQKLTEELLSRLSSLPSAEEYGYLSVWSVWQKKDTAILNLRPSNNMCLPVTVLHPAFARLLKCVNHTPESGPVTQASDAYISALRVAFALCEHMPEPYAEDESRCRDLCHQLRGLLGSSLRPHSLYIESNHPLEAIPSKADLYVEKNGMITALGIVKGEFESGDPYMSVSRAYQALVHRMLTVGEVTDGAPCILISVAGPLFMISGAFYDGKHCIVEPLVGPYMMFRRNGHRLGTALFAMHQALDELASRSPGPSFPPCVPRVYPSYTDSGNHTHPLYWADSKMVRTSDPPNNLLFTASTLSNSDSSTSHRVLVKLMDRDARAGLQVHKLLDDVDLAPRLLGTAELDGVEFAVVMEYLAPEDGWMTLQAYMKAHPKVSMGVNHPGLQKALQVMKEGGVVHGDFRPYNIMVRSKNTKDEQNESGDVEMTVGGQEAALEIRVIDFESAGELGKAKYPWRLNERIPWPGKPGSLIGEYDDVTLLYRTLDIKQKGWA